MADTKLARLIHQETKLGRSASPSTDQAQEYLPTVKRLRWKAVTDQSDVAADSIVGKYRIMARYGMETTWGLEFENSFDLLKFPTMELAKAAAQADFERRVLSALIKRAPKGGEA